MDYQPNTPGMQHPALADSRICRSLEPDTEGGLQTEAVARKVGDVGWAGVDTSAAEFQPLGLSPVNLLIYITAPFKNKNLKRIV